MTDYTLNTPSSTDPHPSESDLEKQLRNYRLTTAEILYHMPDHPKLLQSFIWQDLDIAPEFPTLKRFLDFWAKEIEGKLHSVRMTSAGLIMPAKWSLRDAEFVIH